MSVEPDITLVVAAAENGTIGKNGMLPWRIPGDMKRFKALTIGKPCIMGRKTWDSLPRKPLPGRTNIVVTRDATFAAAGARVAHGLDEALTLAGEENPDAIMIIGGEAIYAAALPRASRIELTEVAGDFSGDAFLPPFDPAEWHATETSGRMEENGISYRYVTLERRA